MKKLVKKLINVALSPLVLLDYITYKRIESLGSVRFSSSLFCFNPQIKDKTVTTGFDRHYVYHLSWAARVLSEIKPEVHIDISSSLYFCGMISAFIKTEFYDFRPATLGLSNLKTDSTDLTRLHFTDNSIKSLSCMHTVEHIGLGRYGDTLDPNGDIKAADELTRVLAPGGSLLFVVPVGKVSKIEWNAHRIYSYDAVITLFPALTLSEFALIPENETGGGLIRNADPKLTQFENYACGCFRFIKKL